MRRGSTNAIVVARGRASSRMRKTTKAVTRQDVECYCKSQQPPEENDVPDHMALRLCGRGVH